MKELALFAGAGGGLLATHHLLGWRCVGYVEMAEYPCKVVEARINDGLLSKAPIYQMHTRDFIRSGIAESYRGLVDVITAGFPCQPFSRAGKRLGKQDERNGWPDTIAIIRLVQPRYVLLENSSTLISESYFGTILGDLAASGYDARWDCIPAQAVGACHERDRVWIMAHSNGAGQRQRANQPIAETQRNSTPNAGFSSQNVSDANSNGRHKNVDRQLVQTSRNGEQAGEEVADAQSQRFQKPRNSRAGRNGLTDSSSEIPHTNGPRPQRQGLQGPASYRDWWETEPALGRVAHGVADRVDRITALGNGQVPAVVAAVWRLLAEYNE